MDEQSVAPLLGVVPRVPAWSGHGHLGHGAGQNHGQRAETALLGHLRAGQDARGRRTLQVPRQQHTRVSIFCQQQIWVFYNQIYIRSYIEDFTCTNTKLSDYRVRDSIKSFPSGHASVSVFTAIFLIVSDDETNLKFAIWYLFL